MLVSIIIPAYNSQNFLSRCLDSIINQVYKNLEIIIIDDASTDSTKQIIKNYAQKDNRIIPFYQTVNKGASAARNIGLKAATGEYIMFVDSDDSLTKDAIRRMVDISNKYNSDFVDSYQLLRYKKTNGKIVDFTEKKIPKKLLIMGNLKNNSKILNMTTYVKGKFIKRSLFNDLEFDESLKCYEDMVLEHKLKTKVNNYVFMNKVVYIYYQRENSSANSLGKCHLCFIDAAKIVKGVYKDYDKNIKDEIDALLISNMFLTCLTKIVKIDDSLNEITNIARDFLLEITKVFPNYKDNKKINSFIRKYIDIFINNEDKLKKFIKKTKNINFINLYFTFLSKINKYEIKNPLE